MTAYSNFVSDYPDRCRGLLERFFRDATKNDLEVTLLLSIAASGLVFPFVRLTEDAHPSNDAARYKPAKDILYTVLNQPFLASELWQLDDPRSWRFGEMQTLNGNPESWGLDKMRAISKGKMAKSIAKVLRNALAHGNIFTLGGPNIKILVFLSRISHDKPELGYNCITVSPLDFKRFVFKWLDTLSKVELHGWAVLETDLFETLAV